MGVKEQMIEILRSGETSRIRFTYRSGSVTAAISGDTFRRVAANLASGHLHVVPGRHALNMITYSAWANGADAANTFYLGNNLRWSRDFNALVVHESVHAHFDLNRISIPWADNEAAAYIAQGYYLWNSGFPESRIDFGEHYRTGYHIASTLAQRGDAASMIADLRQNLIGDSRYRHYITATFHGNG